MSYSPNNPNGQATMANSAPVVLASDQSALTANAGTNLNTSLLALDSTVAKDSSLSTLNTSVNTLLKPANTLAAVTTVSTVTNLSQMGGVAISLNTGVRDTGTQRVTIATNDSVPVTGTFFQATQPVSGTVSVSSVGGTVAVSAVSLPLPSGASTSAKQDTGHTSLGTIAGAVAGSEMQVDVLTMPTTTVQATNLDIRDLLFATDKVDVSGSTLDVTIAEFPPATALADDTANPTTTSVGSFLMGFDGTTWDRVVSTGTGSDLHSSHTQGCLCVQNHNLVFNGTSWDRMRGTLTDGVLVNLGANNDVAVTGTVTANAGSGTFTTKETRSTTPTQSSVAGSATTVTLLASNANRLGATFFNDGTANLYLKLGATASTTSFTTIMYPNDYYEVPFAYTGIIDGISSSATGNTRVTEIT